MNRKELVRRIANVMRENNIRKPVSSQKQVFHIWVFTHRSKLRLPNGGGVRTDKLCVEIAKAINGSRKYGLGELELYAVKRFAPMTDFNGKLMTFHAKDFNMQYNPKKPTPINRKTG